MRRIYDTPLLGAGMRNVLCALLIFLLAAGMVVLPASPLPVLDTGIYSRGTTAVAAQAPMDASAGGVDLLYTVTVEPAHDTAHVDLKVQGLVANTVDVGFYLLPVDIHDSVTNLAATADGVPVQAQYGNKNSWEVSLAGRQGAVVDVSYDIAKIVMYGGGLPYASTGHEAAVIIGDLGGLLMGEYFFLVPKQTDVQRIRVTFDLPASWQIVCPYVDHGSYFEVPKVTGDLISNFVHRQGIYFGEMRFYSEKTVGNCTVKFGVLKADKSWDTSVHLKTQADADAYVQRTAAVVEKYASIFGENPYPVISMYTYFASGDPGNYQYPGTREVVGGYQYWDEARYDELIGHLQYSWFCFYNLGQSPISADDLIAKGLGESYMANKIAYDLTGDVAYLGKVYQYYLVYKRAFGTSYMSMHEIVGSYYKGAVCGLYLDSLVQRETHQSKSIYDVFAYLYKKYKNSGHDVRVTDLEDAVNVVTSTDNSAVFAKYIYGDQEVPVGDIVDPYRNGFDAFLKVLESNAFGKQYHSSPIPFFVDLEMAIPLDFHIPFGILCNDRYQSFAKYIFTNYEVDALTKADVETALSKLTGQDCIGFFDRWRTSYGELTLDDMKEWLRSYMPYAPQGLTGAFLGTSVDLRWNSVQQRYPGYYYWITGYAVYRGTSLGTETLLANVGANATSYVDTGVAAGTTYYYYVKSIEDQPFGDGQHMSSGASAEVTVVCKDVTAPEIVVSSPGENTVVHDRNLHLFLKLTDADSGIASVTVNGTPSSVLPDGSVDTSLQLTEGSNTIFIMAADKAGNQATKTFTVTYQKLANPAVLVLQIGAGTFTVDGKINSLDSPPVIKNDRTLLPIRAVVEALGGTIGWDAVDRKVTVSLGSTTLELWIGDNIAKVNGVDAAIDPFNPQVVPEIVSSRTMLPLRFVVESLGCDVQWNGGTKTITITYKP